MHARGFTAGQKNLWKTRSWAPGLRAAGLPGREAVAGRGPRAAGQKKKGLLLAKPVIMAVVEGRIFLLAYRRTVF